MMKCNNDFYLHLIIDKESLYCSPAQIVQAAIAVSVFFSFMLQFYIPTDIMWKRLKRVIPEDKHNMSQIWLRIVMVAVVTGWFANIYQLQPEKKYILLFQELQSQEAKIWVLWSIWWAPFSSPL